MIWFQENDCMFVLRSYLIHLNFINVLSVHNTLKEKKNNSSEEAVRQSDPLPQDPSWGAGKWGPCP